MIRAPIQTHENFDSCSTKTPSSHFGTSTGAQILSEELPTFFLLKNASLPETKGPTPALDSHRAMSPNVTRSTASVTAARSWLITPTVLHPSLVGGKEELSRIALHKWLC